MKARTLMTIVPLLLRVMLLVACDPAQDTERVPAGTRNVILFVGDGFGAAQTSLGVQYARLIENRELNIESLMRDGLLLDKIDYFAILKLRRNVLDKWRNLS